MSTISGIPSDRSDASSVPPQSCSASSSFSLSAVMWRSTRAVDVAVADERADPAVTDEALRVDDEPVAAGGERRQRLEREVGAGERADDHPGCVPDRVADPAVDVRRRPRLGERVDRHDPPVALVVEREARRALGRAASGPGSRTPRAAARARRDPRRPSGRRARRRRRGSISRERAGAVPDHAAGPLRRARRRRRARGSRRSRRLGIRRCYAADERSHCGARAPPRRRARPRRRRRSSGRWRRCPTPAGRAADLSRPTTTARSARATGSAEADDPGGDQARPPRQARRRRRPRRSASPATSQSASSTANSGTKKEPRRKRNDW